MNEMKPKDVMRALECCETFGASHCDNLCPMFYNGTGSKSACRQALHNAALALLREKDALLAEWDAKCNDYETALMGKDAEIERLRKAKYIYSTVDYCADDLVKAQEEIERLKQENKDLHDNIDVIIEMVSIARAEAITEFAERLKETLIARGIYPVIVKNSIEKIAKEMKEGNGDG